MFNAYPAIFFHEQDGGYSAVFPDLNHLATCDDTLQETMEMAEDALRGYLYVEKIDGHEIPAPTPLDLVDIHCEDDPEDDYADEDRFVKLIIVDVEEYVRTHFHAKSRPI
jgi:predicted RNase H-like HicB family nuclease